MMLISVYISFVAAAAAFAWHWLLQDGHPLEVIGHFIEDELIGDDPPLDLRSVYPNMHPLETKLRYVLGMLLGGCAICQSFWIALAFSIIFTPLPLVGVLFSGVLAMTITYKIF